MRVRLQEIRKQHGIAQHKIGQVLDLPQSRISEMERGKRRIHLDEAAIIANFMKVKIDDLITMQS